MQIFQRFIKAIQYKLLPQKEEDSEDARTVHSSGYRDPKGMNQYPGFNS